MAFFRLTFFNDMINYIVELNSFYI